MNEMFLSTIYSHKSNLQRIPNGPLLQETEIWAIIMQLTAGKVSIDLEKFIRFNSVSLYRLSGLRAIHQAGLACRTLDPTKIIITGKRVRFSFLGISDIVYFDPNQTNQMTAISNYQQVTVDSLKNCFVTNLPFIVQEDLTSLGKLVLALSCRCYQSVHEDKIQSSIQYVTRNYSSDLKNLIL